MCVSTVLHHTVYIIYTSMSKYFTYVLHVCIVFVLTVVWFVFFYATSETGSIKNTTSALRSLSTTYNTQSQQWGFLQSIQDWFSTPAVTAYTSSTSSNTYTPYHGTPKDTIQFNDIDGHIYENDIRMLAEYGIVVWQKDSKQIQKFYPENYVRRTDAITMITETFEHEFIDVTSPVRYSFTNIPTTHPFFSTIQLADRMGILDTFVDPDATTFAMDAFVTQKEIFAIMEMFHVTKNEYIDPDSLSILQNPSAIVKRWELAHIIASVIQNDTYWSTQKVPWNSADIPSMPWIDSLVELGVISEYMKYSITPTDPITREDFLEILVTMHHIQNPSIPLTVANQKYFSDVTEGEVSILSQAKNLWLTALFEKQWRLGSLYLEPLAFVATDEAITLINTISPKKLIMNTMSHTSVSYEEYAQWLLLAYSISWENKNIEQENTQKSTMGDVWNKIVDML